MQQVPPAILGRHARALRLLTYLQSGPGFNANELATEFNVSRRTIYRDLNLIREAGVPVYFDTAFDAYRLGNKAKYFEPLFTEEELCTLVVLIRSSVLHACPYYATAATELLSKLLARQPGRESYEAIRLRNSCAIRTAPLPSLQTDVVRALIQSIAAQTLVRVQLDHDGSLPFPGEESVTGPQYWAKIAPFRFVFSDERWSVVGRSMLHRETISLDIRNIRNLELTDEAYTVPRGFRRL